MDTIKTGWDFFQNEVLGMSWLNRLLGNLLNSLGLDTTGKIGGSVQFFIYDTIKILMLLGVCKYRSESRACTEEEPRFTGAEPW